MCAPGSRHFDFDDQLVETGRNVDLGPAFGSMRYCEPPTADAPLLLLMIVATAVLGSFAGALYWLQRPHVIDAPAQAIAVHEVPRRAFVLQASSTASATAEKRATLAADEANEELGLSSPVITRSEPPPSPRQMEEAAPRPKAKPKRVAQKRSPVVAERQPWRSQWQNDWRNDWRNDWASARREWRSQRRDRRNERREWQSDRRSPGTSWFGRSFSH